MLLKEKGVEPGHDQESQFPKRHSPAVVGRSRQAQQRTLATGTELRVVMIGHLTLVKGIGAAALSHPIPSTACRSAGRAQPPRPGLHPSYWHQPGTVTCTDSAGSVESVGWRPRPVRLNRLAATDRFHGVSGLKLKDMDMGAAVCQRWDPRSGVVPSLKS